MSNIMDKRIKEIQKIYEKKIKEEIKNQEKPKLTTRQKIVDVYNALNNISANILYTQAKPFVEFSYWKVYNINIITPEINVINSIFKESDELKTYNKEKENIAKLTCIQNEGGSPSLIPNPKGGFQYQFGPKEQVLFNVEIVKLDIKYKQLIIKIEQRNKEIDTFNALEIKRPKYIKIKLSQIGPNISIDEYIDLFLKEDLIDSSEMQRKVGKKNDQK
jgi:hypothetical protein